jgi:hypothetical protein
MDGTENEKLRETFGHTNSIRLITLKFRECKQIDRHRRIERKVQTYTQTDSKAIS